MSDLVSLAKMLHRIAPGELTAPEWYEYLMFTIKAHDAKVGDEVSWTWDGWGYYSIKEGP